MDIGLLILGVLQIVLFFKLWRMCNDVREMKEYFISEGKKD